MRHMTLPVFIGLGILAYAAGTQADDHKAHRGPLRAPVTMKALGAAEVVEGAVAFDKILYAQTLAYATPGMLKSDVVAADGGTVVLKAGTPVYGGNRDKPDASTVWCTRSADIKPTCVAPGAGKNLGSYYAFAVSDNAAVEGWQPQGVMTRVTPAPDVVLETAAVPSGYRVTFALKSSATIEIEKTIWRGTEATEAVGDVILDSKVWQWTDAVVKSNAKFASRHDMIFSSRDGEALYVTYDAAGDSFSAKRFATEADALAN